MSSLEPEAAEAAQLRQRLAELKSEAQVIYPRAMPHRNSSKAGTCSRICCQSQRAVVLCISPKFTVTDFRVCEMPVRSRRLPPMRRLPATKRLYCASGWHRNQSRPRSRSLTLRLGLLGPLLSGMLSLRRHAPILLFSCILCRTSARADDACLCQRQNLTVQHVIITVMVLLCCELLTCVQIWKRIHCGVPMIELQSAFG